MSTEMTVYIVLGVIAAAVVSGALVYLCMKYEIARYIVAALIFISIPVSAFWCGNELRLYYGAEGGVIGYLNGLFESNQVEQVEELKFQITNTEFTKVHDDVYSIQILTNDVVPLEKGKTYGIFINDTPCYGTYNMIATNEAMVSAKYQYNFYNKDNGLKQNDTLSLSVAVYKNYSRLEIETSGGSEAVKNWNYYFNRNNFLLEVKEISYERDTSFEYGEGQVPEMLTVKFVEKDNKTTVQTYLPNSKLNSVPEIQRTNVNYGDQYFIGWSLDHENVKDLSDYNVTQDVTFYAVYETAGAGLYEIENKNFQLTWEEFVETGKITVEDKTISAFDAQQTGYLIVDKDIEVLNSGVFGRTMLNGLDLSLTQVTEIEQTTFRYAKFETLKLPTGLNEIEQGALGYMELLKEITIPTGVTTLSREAFFRDTSLQSVYIPSTVTTHAKVDWYDADNWTNAMFQEVNENCVIYMEAISKPAGFGTGWNLFSCPTTKPYYDYKYLTVKYGYSYEEYLWETGAQGILFDVEEQLSENIGAEDFEYMLGQIKTHFGAENLKICFQNCVVEFDSQKRPLSVYCEYGYFSDNKQLDGGGLSKKARYIPEKTSTYSIKELLTVAIAKSISDEFSLGYTSLANNIVIGAAVE